MALIVELEDRKWLVDVGYGDFSLKPLAITPGEVQSWFGVYSANDTIGGQAKAITVHPDDEVAIFDGASTAEAQGSGGGSTLRMGIHGVADTRTTGGDGVDINLHSDAVPLGSTVTDTGGAFTANVRIPHDTTAGNSSLVGSGRRGFAAIPVRRTTRFVGTRRR